MASSTSLLLVCFVGGAFAYPFIPLDNTQTNDTAKELFQHVPLSADFGSYDSNANGYIDLQELAKVTGTTLDDARKPFMDADLDDDDQISPSEFQRAPWSFRDFNREDSTSEEKDDDDEEEAVFEEEEEPEEEELEEEEKDMFYDADRILVDVGKPVEEEEEENYEDDTQEKLVEEEQEERKEEEEQEERKEEEEDLMMHDDDEEEREEMKDLSMPILSADEEEILSEVDNINYNKKSDEILDNDDLLKEETVFSEGEFVENAIY